MEYNVTGRVSFDFDLDVEAESEEEAREIAESMVMDFYCLDRHGAYHNPKDVDIEVDDAYLTEYEDDE